MLSQTYRVIDSFFYVMSPALIWVTNDMNAIYYALFGAVGIGTFGVAIAPESPDFLFKKRKFD